LARKEWLVIGDRNSKFFQTRANARRKKKIAMKLKDECGIWIDNQKMIADKFITDYTNMFKSAHNFLSWDYPKFYLSSITKNSLNCQI